MKWFSSVVGFGSNLVVLSLRVFDSHFVERCRCGFRAPCGVLEG